MATSQALQATMKKQGERSGSCFEEKIGYYNKATKFFINFKKLCYKSADFESRHDSKVRMERAYKFFDLMYNRTAIDANGAQFLDADKNKYSDRLCFIKLRLETERCSKCKMNRHEIEQPCIFFKGDCGDFICGKCYAELLDVIWFYFFFFLSNNYLIY
jgi:hypothetical protein